MSPTLLCICQNRKKNHRPVTSTQQDHYCKNESAGGVTGSIALAVSYRTDCPDRIPPRAQAGYFWWSCPLQAGSSCTTDSTVRSGLKKWTNILSTWSDPVSEGSISQLPHLPSEQRGDCPCGHCCVGIPKQPIICRSTYLRKAKYFC